MLRFRPAVLVPFGLAACASGLVGPSVPTGRDFELKVGESVSLSGTDLRVRFDQVESDSRCPADAICVWAGEAVVALTVIHSGGADRLALHTEPGTPREASVGDWVLVLTGLQPYPFSGRPITAADYRATLRVDHAAR